MVVAPFPLAWLPRWSRADVARTRAVLRGLLPASPAPEARRDALGPRLRALFGAPCEAWPLAPRLASPLDTVARFERVAVAAVLHHRAFGVLGALIDAPFALTLASRALGSDDAGARHAGAERAYSPALEGALALLCAQAAQLACAPSPAPVVRAVSDRVADLFEAMAPPDAAGVLLWPWRTTVGLDAGDVTLVLDPRALVRSPERAGDGLRAVGSVELDADVVAARQALSAREVASIEPGDVLAFDDDGDPRAAPWLALGAVELPLARTERGYAIAGPARTKRSTVTEGNDDDRAVRTELLAELPVEVEIVLGRAAFSVAEVGAWRVGEVIALPTKLGEPVLVRAGGRVVARGELCDVDGAVGVRVTERL